jgi:hypothetical protein
VPHASQGACLCGTVRFEIAAPYRWFAHCHCSMCRKQSGALFGTSLGVAERCFRWLAGAEEVEHYRSSTAFERPFCRRCGAKVPARSHEADSWTVPAGLVREDVGIRPRSHIFVASKSPLVEIVDALPQHAAYPPGVALPSVAVAPRPRGTAALEGSCLCGEVLFASGDRPREIAHCHCAPCRASSGAAFTSFVAVTAAAFRWVRGKERVRLYRPAEGRAHGAAFCATCGSAAPLLADQRTEMLLPAGALDTDLDPLPSRHLHYDGKAPWYEVTRA